jgi:hypothetical protein
VSLERLWREGVEGEPDAAAPDAFAAVAQPVTNVREPAPAAADPALKPMRERYSVVNDLEAALPELPEVFDRRDITRAQVRRGGKAAIRTAGKSSPEDQHQEYEGSGGQFGIREGRDRSCAAVHRRPEAASTLLLRSFAASVSTPARSALRPEAAKAAPLHPCPQWQAIGRPS